MKRFFAATLCVMLLLSLFPAAYAAAGSTTLNFNLTNEAKNIVTVPSGTELVVSYTLENTTENKSYDIESVSNVIAYDKEFFEYMGDENLWSDKDNNKSHQTLSYGQELIYFNGYYAEKTEAYDADQLVGTFKLKVKATEGTSVINIVEATAFDEGGDSYKLAAANLTVNIGDTEQGEYHTVTYVTPTLTSKTLIPDNTRIFIADEPTPLSPYDKFLHWELDDGRTRMPGTDFTVTQNVTFTAKWNSSSDDDEDSGSGGGSGSGGSGSGSGGSGGSGSGGSGGSGSGGGGSTSVYGSYTTDIFGNTHTKHNGYINGYPDGTVKPEGNITREEIAAVLYRINSKKNDSFMPKGDVFPDVVLERWSVKDIEYMSNEGIINGYTDGEFKPERALTRAEFAALVRRFTKLNDAAIENAFPDLDKSHWAYEDILVLAKAGFIGGYEDGTVRPEREITRAEVMTVINKILGRKPSENYIKNLSEINPYSDLNVNSWYYAAVLEATITHGYTLNSDRSLEIEWKNWK